MVTGEAKRRINFAFEDKALPQLQNAPRCADWEKIRGRYMEIDSGYCISDPIAEWKGSGRYGSKGRLR